MFLLVLETKVANKMREVSGNSIALISVTLQSTQSSEQPFL